MNRSQPRSRRTKIIATMGPASRTPERVRELIKAGVNVFRLNFSHGSYEEHLENAQVVRAASSELNTPVALLQDLSGPKIRITKVDGDFAQIADGATVHLYRSNGTLSSHEHIFVEGLDPIRFLRVGQHALLADGIIMLRAVAADSECVTCVAVKGGRLRSRVGIAFPDSHVDLPATTEKDMKDLDWGINNEMDYVAVSFVQNAEDILRLRRAIDARKGHQCIISKIERKAAVENLREILDVSDAVMVARGDLGLEFPLEQIPLIQKHLIEQCNYRGLPAIVATQMLQSMVSAVRPTRAEVSDVATAVMNGADALMLSEETTLGEHPVACVEYLSKISVETEKSFEFDEFKLRLRNADRATVPDAVSYAACAAAVKVSASAIIACTQTGNSARLVAKYRPQQPLYGASPNERTLRRLCLYWGVIPISCGTTSTHLDEVETALRTVQHRENLPNGSRAVVTGGLSVGQPGATSVLEIRELDFPQG